jgi:hypothetical protein
MISITMSGIKMNQMDFPWVYVINDVDADSHPNQFVLLQSEVYFTDAMWLSYNKK